MIKNRNKMNIKITKIKNRLLLQPQTIIMHNKFNPNPLYKT